jgi:hypothetical protein
MISGVGLQFQNPKLSFEILKRQAHFEWEDRKPVTDEQVFYDKFLCDKFYLPSARVYMQQILYDKFSYDKFYYWCERVNKFTLTIY